MRSAYSAYLNISNKYSNLQADYKREQRENERPASRMREILEERRELQAVAAEFERVKEVLVPDRWMPQFCVDVILYNKFIHRMFHVGYKEFLRVL